MNSEVYHIIRNGATKHVAGERFGKFGIISVKGSIHLATLGPYVWFSHSFTYLFSWHLLSTYHIAAIVLGVRDQEEFNSMQFLKRKLIAKRAILSSIILQMCLYIRSWDPGLTSLSV